MPSSPSIHVRLAPFVHQLLKRRAESEGRSMSSLAAFLIEQAVRRDGKA
jgi:hypothetical protein